VGLVSEYIHGVAHDDSEAAAVRTLASKTWSALKRSAKAGPRRTVRLCGQAHMGDGLPGGLVCAAWP